MEMLAVSWSWDTAVHVVHWGLMILGFILAIGMVVEGASWLIERLPQGLWLDMQATVEHFRRLRQRRRQVTSVIEAEEHHIDQVVADAQARMDAVVERAHRRTQYRRPA